MAGPAVNPIKRILIVNRGEIAARIARTVRRMGLVPVIAFSDADRETLAVTDALPSERVRLGPGRAGDSYLNTTAVLQAAHKAQADALHPGYGFLSENSDFARQVRATGLVWIGPSPETMDRISSKAKAKDAAEQCQVPVLPGFRGEQNVERFVQEARLIGYPVLLKAAAGGGGRGIRHVANEKDLRTQFGQASTEALNAFGDGELILEKYLPRSRHIEVQIFGDTAGDVIHLGERDCSVQRRHQKLIEESPSPAVGPELRRRITDAAVRLGRTCAYQGAGTVEFLLTPEEEFYFLEVNARLQVEHPVTELVTGLDLVEWQIRVARGEKLPLKQNEIRFSGHAVQLRLYAEDPYQDYRPQTGRIEAFTFPDTARVDHFLTARTEITPFYDSMLAKLIVHGPTRADALSRALQALDHTLVSGLITNHTYLRQILLSDFFTQGQAFTQTLDQVKFEKPRPVHTGEALDLASLAEFISVPVTGPLADWSNGPAHAYAAAWRNASGKMELRRLRRDKSGNCLILDSPDRRYRDARLDGTRLTADTGEHVTRAIVHRLSGRSEVLVNGEIHSLAAALAVQPGSRREADPDLVMAPMAGTINSVQTLPGAQVQAGDVLAVIEAMKMQLELRAPRAGEIDSVLVQPGAQVRQRQILLRLKPPATEE